MSRAGSSLLVHISLPLPCQRAVDSFLAVTLLCGNAPNYTLLSAVSGILLIQALWGHRRSSSKSMTHSGSVMATGAQLVVVDVFKADPPVNDLADGKRLVAKIYDPLYYHDDGGYIDSFRCVESQYGNESTAYLRLADLQGTWIPQYYGSFSLRIPNRGAPTCRCVRLILVEFIPGRSMREMDPKSLDIHDRQTIMKLLIDSDTMLYTRDLVYVDKHPRNIILTSPKVHHQKYGRIVFIDFGCVRFRRHGAFPPNAELESKMFPGTYISPLLRWHDAAPGSCMSDFFEWIDWDWQPWLESEYASTAESISDEMRDKFLPKWLTEPPENLPF